MSVFDGFTPTLTVSSNSVVNLDGYHSLIIENGAAVILDATKLTPDTLPLSGASGYIIGNFSNSRRSISLSNSRPGRRLPDVSVVKFWEEWRIEQPRLVRPLVF